MLLLVELELEVELVLEVVLEEGDGGKVLQRATALCNGVSACRRSRGSVSRPGWSSRRSRISSGSCLAR